jgi:hypothetical protein
MTVNELIKALQALPGDMKVQVLDSDRGDPEDILELTRGTWSNDTSDLTDDELDDWEPSDSDPEFIQDAENGKTAVLVIW